MISLLGKTHLTIGGAAWLGVVYSPLTPGIHGWAALAGGWFLAALGALEPDIDTKQSMASQMFGPLSRGVSYLIRELFGGHRKITHSILGAALVFAAFGACIHWWHLVPWVAAAFMTGWLSHVVADMTTVQGCPLLWPVSKHKYGLHLVHTGKNLEHYFIFPLALIANVFLLIMNWVAM